MLFSEAFGIENPKQYEWFDPILSIDTGLFIDPFLIYDDEQWEFVGSHDTIISFFNHAFELIAQSGGNTYSQFWRRATDLLRFPEVKELCLGYTGDGTAGSGFGK